MENINCMKWETEYEIEKMKLGKRSSHSPVVFKHHCSLETHLKEKSNTWAFVFFKKFQDNSDMHLEFKK